MLDLNLVVSDKVRFLGVNLGVLSDFRGFLVYPEAYLLIVGVVVGEGLVFELLLDPDFVVRIQILSNVLEGLHLRWDVLFARPFVEPADWGGLEVGAALWRFLELAQA